MLLIKLLTQNISVANHFVKNLTYPAQFIKGVAQNKEGNRLQSGIKGAYESSPLSYVEKGEPLELNAYIYTDEKVIIAEVNKMKNYIKNKK